MINTITLVGRLVRTPELKLTENGKKVSIITLAVSRSYKNQNGEYDTDFLDCTLWTGVAESTAEYCKSGDIIGVRGKLQSRIIEDDNGSKYKKTEIIADRVTFLSSAKKSESNVNDDEILTENSSELENIKIEKKEKRKK